MLSRYGTAILAGSIAGLSSIVTALGDNAISAQEYATAGLAFLVGLGVIKKVTNGK